MSEYIKREDVEKAIMDCPVSGMLDLINLQTAIINIDTIPSADVVEVVRCKDCKHKVVTESGEYNPEDIVCDYWQSDGLTDNDFCSQGEERRKK